MHEEKHPKQTHVDIAQKGWTIFVWEQEFQTLHWCWNNNIHEQFLDPWTTSHLPYQIGTARCWTWCFVWTVLAASDELSQPLWATALNIGRLSPVKLIGVTLILHLLVNYMTFLPKKPHKLPSQLKILQFSITSATLKSFYRCD